MSKDYDGEPLEINSCEGCLYYDKDSYFQCLPCNPCFEFSADVEISADSKGSAVMFEDDENPFE